MNSFFTLNDITIYLIYYIYIMFKKYIDPILVDISQLSFTDRIKSFV